MGKWWVKQNQRMKSFEVARRGKRWSPTGVPGVIEHTPAILGGNKEVQEFVEIPQIPASALRLE